ncbi:MULTISPECIES: hypothetical protein [unclassified Thermosipho (in: thermotogales)]|uniref:hypothetical protein n=1 Tax=unclassified Thermosipho (in: thermotogales) TaxID=2676525 RepID=UPI000984DB28|nr:MULTISPECIES: hypothetical protein [unclassified Thermosipho (in: thermotogales)]MBT1248565.1 hypothetical protein [Thermosipho sp. 1244]OOC47350.1 hypothetical protein XO09_01915 [Thermosipho sp. 1223]
MFFEDFNEEFESLDEFVESIRKKTNCPECVQCGYCCKITPCYYGKWNNKKKQCEYLTDDNKCGIYDKIVELEKDKEVKMFGSGCCLNYMNPERLKKLSQK